MGVMPMPLPMSTTPGRVRTAAVSRPYGPSKVTGVPGVSRAIAAVPSPTTLAVTRIRSAVGTAESESGWPRVRPGPPNLQTK